MKRRQTQHPTIKAHISGILSLALTAVGINYWMMHPVQNSSQTESTVQTAGSVQTNPEQTGPQVTTESVQVDTKIEYEPERVSDAIAVLRMDQLYVVDEQGRVLAPADSIGLVDLPIVSGESLQIHRNQVQGDKWEQVLTLLKTMHQMQPLYTQCSELVVDQQYGIVVYMDWDRVMPVILGGENLEHHLHKLKILSKQRKAIPEMQSARYVDLRIKGRAVIKQST